MTHSSSNTREKHSPNTGEKYPIYKSSCCRVGVSVGGVGETHYYICNKCDKPCNFEETKPSQQCICNGTSRTKAEQGYDICPKCNGTGKPPQQWCTCFCHCKICKTKSLHYTQECIHCQPPKSNECIMSDCELHKIKHYYSNKNCSYSDNPKSSELPIQVCEEGWFTPKQIECIESLLAQQKQELRERIENLEGVITSDEKLKVLELLK